MIHVISIPNTIQYLVEIIPKYSIVDEGYSTNKKSERRRRKEDGASKSKPNIGRKNH